MLSRTTGNQRLVLTFGPQYDLKGLRETLVDRGTLRNFGAVEAIQCFSATASETAWIVRP